MTQTSNKSASILDYIELCKPRVVALMVLTAISAMILASPASTTPSWEIIVYGAIGISLAAAAGGSINHLIDRRIDSLMTRTKARPIPSGRVKLPQAILLATFLTMGSMLILFIKINITTAILSLLSLIGYAGIYTLILKRATPQNIVIGGLAGAMPPLLGWTTVTNQINANALFLVLIIFTWTPPHFWALAIYRYKEYAKVNVPMLPVTHGIHFTKINIVLYTLLMFAITYLAFAIGMFGNIYLIGLTLLNGKFFYHIIRLYRSDDPKEGLKAFRYSITYLGILFIVMLIDHYFSI